MDRGQGSRDEYSAVFGGDSIMTGGGHVCVLLCIPQELYNYHHTFKILPLNIPYCHQFKFSFIQCIQDQNFKIAWVNSAHAHTHTLLKVSFSWNIMNITGSSHGRKWLFLFLQINYSNDSNVMRTPGILPRKFGNNTKFPTQFLTFQPTLVDHLWFGPSISFYR